MRRLYPRRRDITEEFGLEPAQSFGVGIPNPSKATQGAVEPVTPDHSTPVGEVVDKLIEFVNGQGLLSSYVGVEYDSNTMDIWLYFSKEAEQEELEALADTIRNSKYAQHVDVMPHQGKESSWIIAVGKTRPAGNPKLNGDVGFAISTFSGTMDVTNAQGQNNNAPAMSGQLSTLPNSQEPT